MKQDALQGAEKYTKAHQRRKRWYQVVTGLACVVVFCTVYALILPAITMEKGACEIPEHTHSEACYTQVTSATRTEPVCTIESLNFHQHDDTCYDSEGNLTCGYADFVVHQHDSACYDENGNLWCPLPEIETHEHTGSCYAVPETSAEVHTHTDDCYTMERGELICTESTEPAHVHTDDCYTETSALVCEEDHEHTESCYETTRELTCGYTEEPAHQHTDQCYEQIKTLICDLSTEPVENAEPAEPELICDKTEVILHEHTSDCFDDDGNLICGKIQVLEHQHTDACFTTVEEPVDTEALTCTLPEDENHTHGPLCHGTWELTCGMEEHTHSEACMPTEPVYICGKEAHTHSETCYDEAGELTCGLEEHTHTEECHSTSGLTEEEQAQVDAVIALIDALPTSEEVEAKLDEFDAADDLDGYEAYYVEIHTQGNAAFDAYDALTDGQKLFVTNIAKLNDLEWLWSAEILGTEAGELTDDSAYVYEIGITKYDTGTAPFDADDAPGNDASSENFVVRTFDTITYNFTVKYDSYENGEVFSQARVKLEFVLPATVKQAEFDQATMAWMDTNVGYEPVLTTETRTIDGVERECQVLTCYKLLLPTEDHKTVVPGEFGENLTVNVKMMNNGDTLSPIISACMEYGTWDGDCATHNQAEKKSVTANPITISAAPKYNVQIKNAFSTQASQIFDFSAGNDLALNKNAGQVQGRIVTMGITLQLYNDSASKGLRGVELPTGPITFDLKLTSDFYPSYNTNTSTQHGEYTDVTEDYLPLVWSYGPQMYSNQDGRSTSMTSYSVAYGCQTPMNEDLKRQDPDHSCYNGGTWRAEQNGNTIHFTVSGYDFDGIFPCVGNGGNPANGYYYNKETGVQNIGCFSAAQLHLVQPFKNNDTGLGVLDDFSTDGEYAQDVGTGKCSNGTFRLVVTDVNLNATSTSGQELESAPDSNANHGGTNANAKTDDEVTTNIELRRPGTYENRNLYSSWYPDPGMFDIFGIWEFSPGTCAGNGDDWAVIGTKFSLTWGGYAGTKGDDANKMCAAKWLLKFDPEAIELLNGNKNSNFCNNYSFNYIYAVKPDGTTWSSDAEMKNTHILDLVYFDTMVEARTHGEIVGIMVEAVPKTTVEAIPSTILTTYFAQYAQVKLDPRLGNRKFIICEDSVVWTVDKYTAAVDNKGGIPSMLNISEEDLAWLADNNNVTYRLYWSKNYKPGDGTYNHNDGYHYGDTLLVLSYKANIIKQVEQKIPDSDTLKDTYNLDADQRVVDFVLDPSVTYPEGVQPEKRQTTTVTIVDTLPQYLTYRAGSSYFGGTYTQTAINGGTQGQIDGGVLNEPTVTTNADGTQTLTWVIQDVVVGDKMDLIHYSVNVGKKGDEEHDVPLGTTNVTNIVEITAVGDDRPHSLANGNHAEEGVVLTRGTASAYGKYSVNTVVEPDGQIHYVVYYFNNSTVPIDNILLLDTMPRNGYFGNNYVGSYTVDSWKIDTEKCSPENLTLYYTMDTSYAGKSVQDIPEDTIKSWTVATIGADGSCADMNGKMPVAWALAGKIDGSEAVQVDLTIQLVPGESKGEISVYHNMFSCDKTVTITEEHTVARTLEGLTWLDADKDGVQDSGEIRFSGVKVTLMKLENGTYVPYHYQNDSTKDIVTIETGKQVSVLAGSSSDAVDYETGRYKFVDLPAGTFGVKFEDGSTKISPLIASPANRGGSDDTIDSDGIAAYNSDKSQLLKTVILDIDMPTAEQMNVILYESKYHDSGFYERGYELPSTGGAGTVPYTMGGFLMLTGAAFLLLYNHTKRRKEDVVSS